MRKVTVSVIIVHYKKTRLILNCITSLYKHTQKNSFEVIVIDNSRDLNKNLLRRFRNLKYIKPSYNIGYSAGNNLGVRKAVGKYIFILNPDTMLFEDCLSPLVNFLEKKFKAAIASPSLYDQNRRKYFQLGMSTLTPIKGVFALSFLNKFFPLNPFSVDYWMKNTDFTKIQSVDVVPGSAFLIRKAVYESSEGFDENFFLYFEESDLCKRIKEQGWELYILPNSRLIHYWGKTTPKSAKIKQIFMDSRFYYFKKHYGFFPALMVEFFVRI